MNNTKIPTGSGVKIGVIDTGCQSHKDLRHSIVRQIALEIDSETGTADSRDRNGHGTFVCGIISAKGGVAGVNGVAPDSKIVSIKATDENGITNYNLITQGIYCAVLEGCDIINISIGGDNYNKKLHDAIIYAYDRNIPIVCAAGNDGHFLNMNLIDYPAKYKQTIAIGGCDNTKDLALFSTIGKEIDFVAPSVDIYSTYLNNTYKKMSGTSFAAPYVTGIIALYLSVPENKNKSVESLKIALSEASVDLGNKGKDMYFGNGEININKLFNKNTGMLKSTLLHIKNLFRKIISFF